MADVQYPSRWTVSTMTDLFDDVTAAKGNAASLTAKIGTMDTATAALEESQTAQDGKIAAIGKKVGMKNLFNFDAWKSVPVARGTGTAGDGTYTVSSTAAQCYTEYNPTATNPYPAEAKIKTVPGKKYRFSWVASGLTEGKTYRIGVWKNGANVIAATDTGNITSTSGEVSFTAASDCNFVTFWVNLAENGTSVTLSEIMMREDGESSTYEQYAPSNRELYEMILALQAQMQ